MVIYFDNNDLLKTEVYKKWSKKNLISLKVLGYYIEPMKNPHLNLKFINRKVNWKISDFMQDNKANGKQPFSVIFKRSEHNNSSTK